MSISFACPRCGKGFDIDDRFAGKKGRCKQCGAVMPIPAASPPRAVAVATSAPSRGGANREISPSRRAPVATAAVASSAPPQVDVYGFEDEPSPPQTDFAPGTDEEDASPATPPARPKKKRSTGFFAPRPKKKQQQAPPDGRSALGSTVGRVVIGIVTGIGGLLVTAYVRPALRNLADPNWASRSAIESFLQNQVACINEVNAVLGTVRDVPSAQAASVRANAAVEKWAENLRVHKDRKGDAKDIEALRIKYHRPQADASLEFRLAVERVAMIAGAWEALAWQGSLESLAAIEATIPAGTNMMGFAPPPIRMPPRPIMPPPMNLRMPDVPPAIPPGLGPRPGFGPRPGMGPGSRNRNRNPTRVDPPGPT